MYSSFKAGRYHSHWERQEHQPGEAGWLGGWMTEPSWASLWNHHSNEMLLVVQVTRMAVLCSDEHANQHQYTPRSSEAGQSKHGWAALVCGREQESKLGWKKEKAQLVQPGQTLGQHRVLPPKWEWSSPPLLCPHCIAFHGLCWGVVISTSLAL